LREKRHWENQISSLGGPHYRRYGPKTFDAEGREVPGNRGYKYFGAAKDLPGVRELFEQEPAPPPRKTRAELMKDVTASYYGYLDEDDGILIESEKKAEKIAIQKAVEEWKERIKKGETLQEKDDEEDLYVTDEKSEKSSHLTVPSQKDIEEALLRKKKKELLAHYNIEEDD
jgi:pre-mRNA-splicing factor ISY1